MLYTFLLILLILDSIILVAAILLQSGKGGGLAASFGGATSAADSLIGTRQAGNLLTKASWWAGGIFILLAFVLQLMSTRARVPRSVLDQPVTQTPSTAPAPTKGAAPALPLEPAPAKGAAPAGGQTAPAAGKAAPAPKPPAPTPKQ
jgi:preprotein translocase subunit SecG